MRLRDSLKLYIPFVLSYDGASAEIVNLEKKNAKFAVFLKEVHELPRVNGNNLPSFLIAPVQRIPRYVLLLEEVKKYTRLDHPDRKNIEEAIVSIKKIAALVNETKGDLDRTNDVTRVYTLLEQKPAELIQPHRRLMKEGEVIMYIEKRRNKPRYFYLFNDILLVTKKKTFGATIRFHIKIWANLYNVKLERTSTNNDHAIFSEDQIKLLPHSFQLIAPSKTLIFFAPDVSKEWCDAFDKVIAKIAEAQETKKSKTHN